MVKLINIDELNAAEYNPRITLEPGMKDYEALKNSLEKNGMVEPVVYNIRTGNVVGGHQRLQVWKDLGHKEVLCSIIDVDEYDEKILNVALNKIKGKWDYDKLSELLKDFDLEVAESSGFYADEIALILSNNDDIEDDFEFDDEIEDWEGEFVGGSWVITLVFDNATLAAQWANNEGYYDQIRAGTNTTVIRIDE